MRYAIAGPKFGFDSFNGLQVYKISGC